MTQPVFPGIAQFKAEPPMPGHAPVWHLNGCVEHGNPDDVECWAWLAEITPYWGNEGGHLPRFLARAANCHAALVAALESGGHTTECLRYAATTGKAFCISECADARRAALALAQGEPS